MKNLLKVLLVLTIIAVGTACLVACDNVIAERMIDLSAEETLALLKESFNISDNSFNVKADFKETEGNAVKIEGEAIICLNTEPEQPVINVYHYSKTPDGEKKYFVVHEYYDDTSVTNGPFFWQKTSDSDEPKFEDVSEDGKKYNQYAYTDSGINEGKQRVQKMTKSAENDDGATIEYSGKEYYLGEEYLSTEITITYKSSPESDEETATVILKKVQYLTKNGTETGKAMSSVTVNNGKTVYAVTYSYNVPQFEFPYIDTESEFDWQI